MSRYVVARTGVVYLDEIWLYIARKATIEIAVRVVNSITKIFPLLAANPSIGRYRPILGEGIRSFPVHGYRIYYRQER